MFGARSVLLSVCLTSIWFPPLAHAGSREMGPRLASPQEGEAIVQAAWVLRRGLLPKPDCSHFVHAVYRQAGFPYEYAASRAIFAGVEDFRRVAKPQSGDVIVWRGHIGIVIDPKEHSFYSSTSSGFAIESYQSRYWIGRGIRRFYRFVVNDLPGAAPVLVSVALSRSTSAQVLSNLTKSFPARPPMLIESDRPQAFVRSDILESSLEPAEVLPARTEESPAIGDRTAVAPTNTRMTDQVLVTSHPAPVKKELRAALRRSVDASGQRLLQGGSLESESSVSVVDHFKIVAINLEGDSGFADLKVKQMGWFHYGYAIPRRTTATYRVLLSRQEQGWVLDIPQDLRGLDRDSAVMALTDHLATVQPTPANSPELKSSRTFLHELSPKRKLWNPRSWFRRSRSKTRSLPEMEA